MFRFLNHTLSLFLVTFICVGTMPLYGKKIQKALSQAQILYNEGKTQDAYDFIYPYFNDDFKNMEALKFLVVCSQDLQLVGQEILFQKQLYSIDKRTDRLSRMGILSFKNGDYRNCIDYFSMLSLRTVYARYYTQCSEFAIAHIDDNSVKPIVELSPDSDTIIDEYWPMLSPDGRQLYHTKLMSDGGYLYEELFRTDIFKDSTYKFSLFAMEDHNVGAVAFSPDGRYAFFTGCGNRRSGCDIYFSMLDKGVWSDPLPVLGGVNTNGWESQPSSTLNGNELYFVSERSNGKGKLDIWRSRKVGESTEGYPIYSEAYNLGTMINSVANDFSPSIHPDGKTLYFSSDGRIGFGGADLYHSIRIDDSWAEPENLGYPINMHTNDEGVTFSVISDTIFFSSDRGQSKDIYQSVLNKEHQGDEMIYMDGFLLSSNGKDTLAGVIEFVHMGKSDFIYADKKYGYRYCLAKTEEYIINIALEDYLFFSDHYTLGDLNDGIGIKKDFFLEPIQAGNAFVMENILFESDSDQLIISSFYELDNLIKFLEINSGLKIEIVGYTDHVGSELYNLKLSEQRALSVVNYLRKLISADRITWRGMGEKNQIASNDSESGRAQNRRTVVRIVSM